MFSKHLKLWTWLCCLAASLCLAVSMTILIPERTPGGIEETKAGVMETSVTESAEISEAMAEETAASGTFLSRNAANALMAVFLITGIVMAAITIFFTRQTGPLLGPEPEMFLTFFSVLLILTKMSGSFAIRCIWHTVLFFVLLVSVRGLWSWVKSGLSLRWTVAHRLGLRLSGSNQKKSRYLLFQFVWSLILSAGAAVFFFEGTTVLWGRGASYIFRTGIGIWLIPAGLCLLMLLISLGCVARLAQDVDHLAAQIDHLHQGIAVDVRDGAFLSAEETLIDLNRQKDEAVKTAVTSERFKVDLISNVSHDLRTPLTAILGYGELLQKEQLSDEGKMQLERLNQKAGYMRELVESLFELTKVSSGIKESKKESIDLIRLLEQTLGLFDDQLNAGRLLVRRHYEKESVMIVTDGARMHQVFANLVGNAIKYTLPGTRIHLEVKENEQECTVRMTNIASYEMDFDPAEIVQRFVRGDKARTSRGSGLGLAIAQTYTESVGGSFKVSVDGEQFSAIVTLPMA